MSEMNQTIEIKEILILTGCEEITIVGVVNRDLLRYETQLEIQSTQLNMVINQLQKKNPEIEISEMFQSRSASNGKTFFYLSELDKLDTLIDIDTIYQDKLIRQIRA